MEVVLEVLELEPGGGKQLLRDLDAVHGSADVQKQQDLDGVPALGAQPTSR